MSISRFRSLFSGRLPAVIGMIHVQPLPGTPMYKGQSVSDIIETACKEADIYAKCGVDSILIENMHDIPYMNRNVGPEVVATMTAVSQSIKAVCNKIPCGVQILAGCNKEALACAKAAGLQFIRAEGFVFSHIADEGMMNSDAGELLRYRKMISADDILVFTDLKKKHGSHSITNDLSLQDCADAAMFFQSDGAIITGQSTGDETDCKDLDLLLHMNDNNKRLPVIIGSGVTTDNVSNYKYADALIIGSHFKDDGYWMNQLSKERVEIFMKEIKLLR